MSREPDVEEVLADLLGLPSPRRRGKSAKTLKLVETAHDILAEIQPATVRAVCYRLFVAKLIANMSKSCTNSVSRALKDAREQGDIPWDWIVDESRAAERVSMWTDPDGVIKAAVDQYRRDYWQDQPCRVEVWSEKGTVRGTLGPVLDKYGVTFRVMHGYASATVINEIAEQTQEDERPLVALYAGDWDPSGKHMSDVDLPERLTRYGAGSRLILKRVVLLRTDLAKLPSFEPESKAKDPRYSWFVRTIKTKCYELDAMPPPELRERVAQEIRGHIDLAKWDQAMHVEKAQVQSMQEFHAAWKSLKRQGEGAK